MVGFNLTFEKPDTFTLLNHYTVIMALAFRIIVNKKEAVPMPASLVYGKSVHKVFIALFVEYALCFVLCHNLRLHMPIENQSCGIGKTCSSFCFMCSI